MWDNIFGVISLATKICEKAFLGKCNVLIYEKLIEKQVVVFMHIYVYCTIVVVFECYSHDQSF